MTLRIETVRDFAKALRAGPYTSLGSYPLFFATLDGEAFGFESARENFAELAREIRDRKPNRIFALEVNWEDGELYERDGGPRIESAYAEGGR